MPMAVLWDVVLRVRERQKGQERMGQLTAGHPDWLLGAANLPLCLIRAHRACLCLLPHSLAMKPVPAFQCWLKWALFPYMLTYSMVAPT